MLKNFFYILYNNISQKTLGGIVILIISAIVITAVFLALVLLACAVVNRDSTTNHCGGCPYREICRKQHKYQNPTEKND